MHVTFMKHNRSIGLVRSVIVTEPQALKVIYVETDALLFSINEKNSSEWIVMLVVTFHNFTEFHFSTDLV